MDINGCHVIPEPSDTTEEGYLTTIHRDGAIRGPFKTIQEAVQAAHEWNKEVTDSAKAKLEEVAKTAPVVVETKSEAIAVIVPKPIENPPVIESTKGTELK